MVKIKVVSVLPVRKAQPPKTWQALDFMGKTTTQGPEIKYTLFQHPELYPLIIPEALITADVEDKKTGRYDAAQNEYIDHNITQIYQDGKPLIQASQGRTGGYGGKSPEDRASIETQVAIKIITELEIAGKPVTPALIASRNAWLTKALAQGK